MTQKPNNQPYTTRTDTGSPPEKVNNHPPMGWLKNGNPAGNPNNAPRCGAKRRGKVERCKAPAMANGRCRLHGGKSTGPRTPEGLARSQQANLIHGEYSQESKAELRSMKVAMGLILSPGDAMGLSLDELNEHLANLKRVSQKMKSGEIGLFRKRVQTPF